MLLDSSATLLQKYNKILESLPINWTFDPPGPSKSPNSGLDDKCNVVNVTIGVWHTWFRTLSPGSGMGQGMWTQGRGGPAGHNVQGERKVKLT